MTKISLCMIVKDEEKVLERCLDSIASLVDEIVIVDTGSMDHTKEIAKKYTDQVYDFEWIDDFSAARNFAFSKASMDYVMTMDADEVLEKGEQKNFRYLKDCLLPEIEVVRMKCVTRLEKDIDHIFDEEYRLKLFKRQREFTWEGSIHEMVRLEPVIYDSDVCITHLPQEAHEDRNLENFRKQVRKGVRLNKRLHDMYAKELYLLGSDADLEAGMAFFMDSTADENRDQEEVTKACCVVARAARLMEEPVIFFKYVSKVISTMLCSEICCELGHFYEDAGDLEEAVIWYHKAVFQTKPLMSVASGNQEPLRGLVHCYGSMGMEEQAAKYEER
ncbi:MAG: glycosyltransferase family 2 protein, partial [Lachnospiraceae bacterium]|nr:glycosyltransferase family 2 protein [Lachnospiraceae bacterium]